MCTSSLVVSACPREWVLTADDDDEDEDMVDVPLSIRVVVLVVVVDGGLSRAVVSSSSPTLLSAIKRHFNVN